jgi:hypothetical protein
MWSFRCVDSCTANAEPMPTTERPNTHGTFCPACPRCRGMMLLCRIEPSDQPGHDLRTFECRSCGHAETRKVRFR